MSGPTKRGDQVCALHWAPQLGRRRRRLASQANPSLSNLSKTRARLHICAPCPPPPFLSPLITMMSPECPKKSHLRDGSHSPLHIYTACPACSGRACATRPQSPPGLSRFVAPHPAHSLALLLSHHAVMTMTTILWRAGARVLAWAGVATCACARAPTHTTTISCLLARVPASPWPAFFCLCAPHCAHGGPSAARRVKGEREQGARAPPPSLPRAPQRHAVDAAAFFTGHIMAVRRCAPACCRRRRRCLRAAHPFFSLFLHFPLPSLPCPSFSFSPRRPPWLEPLGPAPPMVFRAGSCKACL